MCLENMCILHPFFKNLDVALHSSLSYATCWIKEAGFCPFSLRLPLLDGILFFWFFTLVSVGGRQLFSFTLLFKWKEWECFLNLISSSVLSAWHWPRPASALLFQIPVCFKLGFQLSLENTCSTQIPGALSDGVARSFRTDWLPALPLNLEALTLFSLLLIFFFSLGAFAFHPRCPTV